MQNKPPLYGLVLAGGRSVRMGQDKTVMHWHGSEQRYHMADMLRAFCEEVYISCRAEQAGDVDAAYKTLPDALDMAGPLNGILSALQAQPHAAWLVVASDLPLLDMETLKYLVEHRNSTGMATTFRSPFDGLPEPLITIWEPAAREALLAHMADGFKCPRKALIRNEGRVRIIDAPWPDKLLNANTPGDAETVKKMLEL